MYLKNEAAKNVQIYRLIGKAATIAACSYRHRIGRYALVLSRPPAHASALALARPCADLATARFFASHPKAVQ